MAEAQGKDVASESSAGGKSSVLPAKRARGRPPKVRGQVPGVSPATGGPVGIVLLSVNCFQHRCVIPFKRLGHRWVFWCLPVFNACLGGCGSSS